MNFNELTTIVLIIIGLAILWTIVRAVLKLTAKLFAFGCMAILALVAIGWFLSQIG